jgi:hypothetical protein
MRACVEVRCVLRRGSGECLQVFAWKDESSAVADLPLDHVEIGMVAGRGEIRRRRGVSGTIERRVDLLIRRRYCPFSHVRFSRVRAASRRALLRLFNRKLVGEVEVAVEGFDAAGEVGFGDDEGWGDDEMGDPGLEDDAFGEGFGGDLVDEEGTA